MNVKRIQLSDNPLFPLPPDYKALDEEGQRLARVNGNRQHLLRWPTPEILGEVYLRVMQFFDYYYLWPDDEDDFDPLFYPKPPLSTPLMLLDMMRQSIMHWLSVAICPRGGAKSTGITKEIIQGMVSTPGWSALYATSTHDNMELTGDAIRVQYEENRRLLDDWRPEYGGYLLPPRGKAPRAINFMRLANRAKFRGVSAKSRLRGIRPNKAYLDDPEYDPSGTTSMAEIRDYMETLIFRILMPAIMHEDASLAWRATFVTKRHYAWQAMCVKPGTNEAEEARFNYWHRLLYRIYTLDPDGNRISCWPEMWPVTIKERLENAKTDPRYLKRKSIEEIEKLHGTPVFNAEYMARPGDAGDSYFGDLTEKTHGWWLEDLDEAFALTPLHSLTKICFWHEDVVHKIPLREFAMRAKFFQTCDPAHTDKSTSDYKAVATFANYPGNLLFVLDIWGAKCRKSIYVKQIFKHAAKWGVGLIGAEAIKEGRWLYEALLGIVRQRAKEAVDISKLPTIRAINPGPITKTAKIEALWTRFEMGHIKLPLGWRGRPHWQMLFDQIAEFNPDVREGGLQHDDHLDCVAMTNFVVRRLRRVTEGPKEEETPVDHLKRGDLVRKDGIPYAHMLPLMQMPVAEIFDILDTMRVTRGTESKA